MNNLNQNDEQIESQPKPAKHSRRGLFKAGALLIPALTTLRAQPAWAHPLPPGCRKGRPCATAYGTSHHN